MKSSRFVWIIALISSLFISSNTSSSAAQEKADTKFYQRGIALFTAERYKEAIEAFKLAAESNPKNADAFYQLGTSYRMVEQFQEAIESYKQALALKPKWADALYGLGVTYGMSGSPKNAVAVLKESINLKPDYWKAHYNLGVAYADLGQAAEAVPAFKEATRLNPKDADSFFNLGMSYQQLNKLKEAENAYAEALLLNSNDAQSAYQIALVYLAMGNRGFATIYYLSLQKLNPELAKKLHDQLFTQDLFGVQAHPQEEGVNAIKTADGFLLVWNEPDLHFTLSIKGRNVQAANSTEHVIFNIDGMFFQVQSVAITAFATNAQRQQLNDQSILEAHRDWETKFIEESLLGKKLSVQTSEQKLSDGKAALFWKFQMPAMPDTLNGSPVTAKKQIDLTMVSGSHVILLNGAVEGTTTEKAVQELLLNAISTLKVSSNLIDIRELQRVLKANPL